MLRAEKTLGELRRTGPFLYVDGAKVGAIKTISDDGQGMSALDMLLDGLGCEAPTVRNGCRAEVHHDDDIRSFKADIVEVEADERTSDVRVRLFVFGPIEVTTNVAP